MPGIEDIFNNIMDKDPISFADNLKAVLGQRAVEVVNNYRDDMAQNLYQTEPETPDVTNDYDVDATANEFDDIDINDFDDQDMGSLDQED